MDRAMLESYIKRQVKKVQKKSANADEEEAPPQKVAYEDLANHEKRKFVKFESQGNTIKIAVRFYQLKKPVTEQHSYVVGVEMGGLSEETSALLEISLSASFKNLRVIIEEQKDRGMVRRTITFQALRYFMEQCSNLHGYSDKRRRTEYRFGIMESEDAKVPRLLTPEQEEKLPLTSISVFESYRTIVVVPVSQICPVTDRITAEVYQRPGQLALKDTSDAESAEAGDVGSID